MNFDEAFERLLGHEGGYSMDKNDPGGETNWGISKRSYPQVDIANLTIEDAKSIYYRDFWLPIAGEQLDGAVGFQLFDYAVNSGVSRAKKGLQKAVGAAVDGQIGPKTLEAVNKYSPSQQIMLILGERLRFMTGLSNWKHHGQGWSRRIAGNLRYGANDS